MSVELTSFEVLTLAESHPLKQLYRAEQAEQALEVRTDYCHARALGATCLRCADTMRPVKETAENSDRKAA